MINLSVRSYQKELLDGDSIPFAAIRQNMKELNTINTYLGGHKITVNGIRRILKASVGKPVTICEIGCGGGDNIKAIDEWCRRKKLPASFIGIDLKEECIAFAKEQYPDLNATWIASDYKNVLFKNIKPDIIFSSLFCHHFTDTELVFMLQWMKENTKKGFFINDLHRHWLAYHSIKMITGIFSRSYLVRNDAPLSVRRGFIKEEWKNIMNKAGIGRYSVNWKWAFRHLIICCNEQ